MTQEDRELLLKDLCARLPYGVSGLAYIAGEPCNINTNINGVINKSIVTDYKSPMLELINLNSEDITIKPYLRSMSSMTEEEKEKLKNISDAEEITSDSICYLEGDTLEDYMSEIPFILCYNIIAWLLENHFDFIGLIPRGLAIEVTPENDPYKDNK